jgi:23S rRNA pseudouridine1911/1915/1917 synthase
MKEWLDIVFEDEALLVVNKPAGLVCHPTKGDESSSVVGRMRLSFGDDHDVRLLNRLDRETGGLLLLGKGAEATRELRRLFERGRVEKEYAAIVHGWPGADAMTLDGPIGMAAESVVAVRRCVRPDGRAARTDIRVTRRFEREEGRFALLSVSPQTGRTHQIRVHLAHCGHPIVGDKIYGGDGSAYLAFTRRELTDLQRLALLLPCHALHAVRLRFHWRGETREFASPPEPWFKGFVEGVPVNPGWEETYV